MWESILKKAGSNARHFILYNLNLRYKLQVKLYTQMSCFYTCMSPMPSKVQWKLVAPHGINYVQLKIYIGNNL